ncbi:YdbH domain-containing protein [Thalassolituus sp.]|uniref:YdbH domain-containing protein n=1 Tax=Thalassolituus sp. TaxID=2030822 RepID=UPI00260CADB5|nr:YdbH domain-containing protein [Thalassolituus sp.]
MSERRESDQQAPALIRRGWFQGIVIALLLTGAAIVALYFSIVPLLNNWLPPLLDRLVAPGSHLQIRSLTSQQFAVDELDIQPAPGVLIQIRNAELNYHGTGLLQGKADSLTAETLRVHITAVDDAPSQPSSTLSPGFDVDLPVITELMTLPVDDIRVQTLEIDTPDISARLTGSLRPDHWGVSGDLRLPHIQESVTVNLQLQRNEQGNAELLAMLSQQEALLAQLWAGLTQTEDTSDARIRLEADLSKIQNSLPQMADLPLKGQQVLIEGKLNSPAQARWPEDLIGDLTATLTTRKSVISENMSVQPAGFAFSVRRSATDDDWSALLATQPIAASIRTSTDGQVSDWKATTPGQALTATCSPNADSCQLEGSLSAELSGLSTTRITLEPEGVWTAAGASSITLPVSVSYQQPAQQELPEWSMTGSGRFSAKISDTGQWSIISDDGLVLNTDIAPWQGWAVSPLTVSVLQNLMVKGSLDDNRHVQARDLRLKIAPFTATSKEQDARLRFAPSHLGCDPGDIDLQDLANGLLGNCTFSARLNDSDWGLWPIPDISLSGPVTITMDEIRERVDASLDLTAANGEIHFRTRAEHDLLSGNGSLQWHLTDASLDWMALGLADMANLTSVQLLNGHLSGQGWLDWQSSENGFELTPDMMLRADGVGLIYDNSITLEEWNAMLALRRPQQGEYQLDAQLSGSKLDSGIPLTNLLARTQTRFPEDLSYFEVDVYEIHTDLLGGRIYAPEIHYDSRKDVNAFGVRLDHLQLSQIAAIEKEAGIKATGLLDGMLPIVLTKEGPMVPGGNLFARDPGGTIKYQDESADALAQADQSVGMAMKLLQNFQYDELQSGVRYQPDGQLNLSLQFEGKNPDFFDGQKTHLNVNLDYNLLDLLESLRIANDVIEKVEQKYK